MRLFIAIQFDDVMRKALTGLQQSLRAQRVTGNYTPAENLHLTLAFVGDYDDPEAVLEAIERADFRPTELALAGVGCFGDLFWVGLADNKALQAYVKRLRRELAEAGIPFDRKHFSPHITLIRRVSVPGGGAVPVSEAPIGRMLATHVSLMRSDRGKNGMIYTEIS
ncbi:MAG: RNA 2',3'-cyclic phosphodiesterase [Lachnospiraceae bacterium]|nr:RNA 2',3'-cyclic phosphodiesterase [Lachnospiraceae bacterium]